MEQAKIWPSSYPRSGNTLLRTILWHRFGLCFASIYPNDLDGSRVLERYIGHIEHDTDGRACFPNDMLPLIKTHGPPTDAGAAIYIVRDGRAASVSLWEFYERKLPLEAIIEGRHRFGAWTDHLSAWSPWERPNTLLLRYEDIAGTWRALEKLHGFLGREIHSDSIPDRGHIAGIDGRWVGKKTDWRSIITNEQLALFNRINVPMMKKWDTRSRVYVINTLSCARTIRSSPDRLTRLSSSYKLAASRAI